MSLDFSGVLDEKNPPTLKKLFDLEEAKASILIYEDSIQKMRIEVEKLIVNSDRSAAQATEMISQVKKLLKNLDKRRKEIIEDPDNFVRSVNGFVRTFKSILELIERSAKKKLGDYTYQLEIKRREEERKAQEEARKKQAEIDKAAKKAGVDTVQLPPMVMPRKKEPVRSDSGTASTRMVWDFEIEDVEKIPRQYLEADIKKINASIKAGIREIEGIRIFERPEVRVRMN